MWDRPSGGWFRVAGRAWRPLDNGNTQDAEGFEGLLIDCAKPTVSSGLHRIGCSPDGFERNEIELGRGLPVLVLRPRTEFVAENASNSSLRAARCALSGYPPPRRCVIPGERCARRFVSPIGARRDENLSFSAIFGGVRRSGAMAWGCVPPVSKRWTACVALRSKNC